MMKVKFGKEREEELAEQSLRARRLLTARAKPSKRRLPHWLEAIAVQRQAILWICGPR